MRRAAFFALSLLIASPAFSASGAETPPQTNDIPRVAKDAEDMVLWARYDDAEKELRGKTDEKSLFLLARVYVETGRFEEAEKALLKITGGGPTKTRTVTKRAEILRGRGKLKEAIALLETDKDPKGAEGRDLHLLLGEYRIESGKRSDGNDALMKVLEDYNDGSIKDNDAASLATVARAAHLLRSPKDANRAYNESERADKSRVDTLLARAELFVEKYDPGHAEEVIREALAIAPKRADAHVLLAKVKLDQSLDFDTAEKHVADALATNPKHADAWAVRAGIALRDMDVAGADAAINSGLAINPTHLELLSLRAATRFLADDTPGYEKAKKDVFALNSEFSRFFAIVGQFAEWEHRYDDIVAMMKEATKIDPEDALAWAELGLTEMRSGDEDAGLLSLKKAWSKDRYNVRVFNTLNMYEQQVAINYESAPSGVFKLRYAKDEKAMLERYVPRLLGEAWASMKSRYGFVPKSPVNVELYGSREHFSVRTSGLPNIGIQGVCFGRVIAAMSPKSEAFNWGNVLWHELGHVFAIQLSKNHVPRWFTEGLSEYETIARRPEWQRELDPQLYAALEKNTLPGAVDMNRAFTHATNGEDVTVAYYAASQLMVFTVEAFGMPRVVEAMKLWGLGVRTPDVIQKAFGVSAKDYDARFRAWAMDRLKRFKGQYMFREPPGDLDSAQKAAEKAPQSAEAQTALAFMLIRNRKGKEAKAALDKAFAIDAKHKDAHYIYARLALAEKEAALADSHLAQIADAGGDGYAIAMLRAEIARASDDAGRTRFFLESAHRFDPNQSEPLSALVSMAQEEKRDADLTPLLMKLSIRDQHNPKTWRLLLERLVQAKQWDEVVRVGESAIFVDVHDAKTHVLYGQGLAAKELHESARFEFESATMGNFHGSEKKEVAARAFALLGREESKLGKKDAAQKHRAEALKLDPNCPEAKE